MNSSAFSVNSLLNDGKYQFSLLLCNCSFSFQGFSKGTPYTLFTSHHLLNISKVFLIWHINSSNCNGRKALHALNPVMDRNWVAGSDQVWLASLLTFYFSVCLAVLLDKLFLRPNCPHACSGGFSYIEGFSHIFWWQLRCMWKYKYPLTHTYPPSNAVVG